MGGESFDDSQAKGGNVAVVVERERKMLWVYSCVRLGRENMSNGKV